MACARVLVASVVIAASMVSVGRQPVSGPSVTQSLWKRRCQHDCNTVTMLRQMELARDQCPAHAEFRKGAVYTLACNATSLVRCCGKAVVWYSGYCIAVGSCGTANHWSEC